MATAYAPASATPAHRTPRTTSVDLAAARHGERDAGHVLRATEVDGGVGDLLRRLGAAEIRLALHELVEDPVLRDAGHRREHRVEHLGPHRRVDVSRAERVDRDAGGT